MSDISFPAILPLPQSYTAAEADARLTEHDFHARTAAAWFNEVWRLIEKKDRSAVETDRMIHGAHASRLHWEYVGDPVNWMIGEWQISRVYATLRRAEPAMWHARRSVELAHQHKIVGFHLASAYEGMARALRLYPQERDQAVTWLGKAKTLLGMLTNEDEKRALTDDIHSNDAMLAELKLA